MINLVKAGDFVNQPIQMKLNGSLRICTKGGFKREFLEINKDTVSSYEVLDVDEQISGASAVGRAAIGSFFLGPVGAAAALSAKKNKAYLVAIEFKDGKRSLIELDKTYFEFLQKTLF